MKKFKRLLSFCLTLVMLISIISSVQISFAQTGTEFIIGDVRVQTLSDTLVRIELKGPKGFEDRVTYHIVNRDFGGAEAQMTASDEVTTVTTQKYTVTVPNNATSLDGITVTQNDRKIWEYTALPDSSNFLPDPGDTPDAYAIADNPRVVPSEWGYNIMPEGITDENDLNGWDTSNDAPDMYIFLPEGNAKQLRQDFNDLTGATELVPLKSLGLWYSRYHAYSADTAIAQIQKFREENFPLEYFVVDTDWKESASTGYDVNTELFPDMEAFIKKAQTEENVNIVFNDHPVASISGANTLSQTEVEYRNTNLRRYLNMGINAWWYDRNWPDSIASPISGITSDSFGMYLYHNITQSEKPDSRPMILANVDGINNGPLVSAPNLASHRYSIQWTDDIKNTSADLKQEIENTVILGATAAIPYVSSDVGGHSGVDSPVLYTRWTQYAAFSPIFRFHSSNDDAWDRAPWLYGEDAENTTRSYINMRYNLLPLYYSLSHENYESGMPIVRRLDFNYPAYAESQDNTQYTLGDNILIAPIWDDSESGASREVFIPDGRWIDVWTGTEYVGPQTITVTHSADTSPIFVRSGTVLALADNNIDYIEQGSWQDITLDVYPSTQLSGSTQLYEDDETSVDYKNGEYRTTDITTAYDNNEVTVNIGKAEGIFDGSGEFSDRNWKVRVHAPESWGNITTLLLNGETAEAEKIEKTFDAMPFATEGGALDADVYEITFTAGIDSQSELRIGFETPQDEQLPEYSDITATVDIEEEMTSDTVDLTKTGTLDWVYFGAENAVCKADADSNIISNFKVTGDKTYTDGFSDIVWSDGDPVTIGNTKAGVSVTDGKLEFDVTAGPDEQYIYVTLGGDSSGSRLSVWDGTTSGVDHIEFSNLYGAYTKTAVIKAYAPEQTTLHFTYEKIDGTGNVFLNAATVTSSKSEAVAVEYKTELLDIPSAVDFTADSTVLDYVHLGCDGQTAVATAINRKNNVTTLLSDPFSANALGTVVDYASPFTYSDATPVNTVTASKNAVFSYDSIEFDVRSTAELRELKVYVGAYQSTLTMEVFDDTGTAVATQTLTATSTQRKILSVKFSSESDSVMHIRLSRTAHTKDTGNIALAAYSVSKVYDTEATLTVTTAPATEQKTVNLDADGILDYVHLGYTGATSAVNGAVAQKTGASILSVPTFSASSAIVGNCGFTFTYTNAESNKVTDAVSASGNTFANNTGSGNSNKDYIEFSAQSAKDMRTLTVYFGAYKADAKIDIFDAERNLLKTTTVKGSASTNYQSMFSVDYCSKNNSKIYVRITEAADYHTTAGNGNISLAAYSVKYTTEASATVESSLTLTLSPATSEKTVNLDAADILDYVHLGYTGATSAVNGAVAQKTGASILSVPTFSASSAIVGNCGFGFTYTNAESNKVTDAVSASGNTFANNTGSGNSNKDYIEFSAQSTDKWRQLVVYFGAYKATATIEIFDDNGNTLATRVAEGSSSTNYQSMLTVNYRSDRPSEIKVRITETADFHATAGNGNISLAAYCVKSVETDGISVTKAPDKTEYTENTAFDPTGMEVTVTYSNDEKDIITNGFEISYDFSETGTKDITVSYDGKTATTAITVVAKVLDKIAISKAPERLSYNVGDTLDTAGAEVIAIYNNGETEDITNDAIFEADLLSSGIKRVKVSYGDNTVFYSVTVLYVTPEIERQDDNTASFKGEARRVYWGYIGTENTEYTRFNEFKAQCGDTFTAEYSPKYGDNYTLTRAGYYRFVVNSDGRDYVYTLEVTKPDSSLPEITSDQNIATLTNGDISARKVYWGYIGENESAYTNFNQFKSVAGDTFTADFSPKNSKNYRMTKAGYYRFVVNYVDENGKSRDLVFTVACDDNSAGVPTVSYENSKITLLHNDTAVNKIYVGYVGKEVVQIDSWADYKAAAMSYYCVQTPAEAAEYTLKNKGCYVILVNYSDENGKAHDKYFTFINE